MKTFEQFTKTTPHIGDYVILKPQGLSNKQIQNFYESHIGKVTDIETRSNGLKVYSIIYEELIPIQSSRDCVMFLDDILHFGTKDEMDFINQTNKYNL